MNFFEAFNTLDEICESNTLVEASNNMTPEEKVIAWHNGTRKENVKACGDEKLKKYYEIADSLGFSDVKAQIEAEQNRRGNISQNNLGAEYDAAVNSAFVAMLNIINNDTGMRTLVATKFGMPESTMWVKCPDFDGLDYAKDKRDIDSICSYYHYLLESEIDKLENAIPNHKIQVTFVPDVSKKQLGIILTLT